MTPTIPPVSTILITPEANWDINPQSDLVIPDVPGDLGSQAMTLEWLTFLQDSLRINANSNLGYPVNHRYAGHRESTKFNLMMQQLTMTLVKTSSTIVTSDTPLNQDELTYISNADLAALNHVRAQCVFNEWLLLKDLSNFWF